MLNNLATFFALYITNCFMFKQQFLQFLNIYLFCANNNYMLTLFFRCIIVFVIVLLIFRLMGKRQLGELQPFELVITLIIADLATIPMSERNVPLMHGVVPLVTLSILHFLISFISRKSILMRKLISGKPVIVINPNGVDYEALKKLNMNFNDLNEALRGLNYFSLDQIQYAIVETNGKITVLPNAENAPLCATDFGIKKEESTLPIMLICDGKIMTENMKVANVDKYFLQKHIQKVGVFKVKDVLIATIDNNGKMYIQPKDKQYQTITTNYKGGGNW